MIAITQEVITTVWGERKEGQGKGERCSVSTVFYLYQSIYFVSKAARVSAEMCGQGSWMFAEIGIVGIYLICYGSVDYGNDGWYHFSDFHYFILCINTTTVPVYVYILYLSGLS
jgi:hypothetical protein